jgi:hypothetical protein
MIVISFSIFHLPFADSTWKCNSATKWTLSVAFSTEVTTYAETFLIHTWL